MIINKVKVVREIPVENQQITSNVKNVLQTHSILSITSLDKS